MSAHLAESLGAVQACVALISGAISSLPAELTLDTDAGRAPAPATSAAWRILQRVNAFQSWPAFASWMTSQILLYGNAVSYIQTDGRGAVLGLSPCPWPWLLPQIVGGSNGSAPRLVYDTVHSTPEVALLGLPRRMLDTDVLHVRGRSDFGIIGRSVLSRAAGPVLEGLEIAQTATSFFRNGMRPSAVMTAPNYLTKPQRETYHSETEEKFAGSLAAGKIPLLEGGWKLEQHSLSSVDAEFLGTRQFSVADIARMFGIPEPLLQHGGRLLQDPTPYVSLLATQTLSPIVTAIEAEFDSAVLGSGSGMHLSIDLDGLMRGSFSAVTAALAALVQSGVITPNDAREELDWPALPDGDALRVGQAPNYPADGSGMPSVSPRPGPTGDGVAMPSHQNQGSMGGNGMMPGGMNGSGGMMQ